MSGIKSTIALLTKELTLLVSYVKNNAFPQPLTERERVCIWDEWQKEMRGSAIC